ncbi:5'/3'-nucleotidase SurE, partial [Pseudomonas aeruginosa]
MRILIANDDGVTAPGIAALDDALAYHALSLIHISEPTRRPPSSDAVFF